MNKLVNCKNCGASTFIYKEDKKICSYCHSEYQQNFLQRRSRRSIWLAISSLAVGILGLSLFLATNNQAPQARDDSQEIVLSSQTQSSTLLDTTETSTQPSNTPAKRAMSSQRFARENIQAVAGWSVEKYNGILLARQRIEQASKYPTYEGGMTFSELLEEIGTQPDTIEEGRAMGGGVSATAKWDSGLALDDGNVTVIIIYDKDTDQITTKLLTGEIY